MSGRVLAASVGWVVVVGLLLGGCGDDDGDGSGGELPSADLLVDELEKAGMEAEMAECMGRAYSAAGFTVEDVRDMGSSAPDADSEKYQRFAEEAQSCAGTDISAPSGG